MRLPPPDELADSPLYLLAALFSARRSKDRALERVTRRRLEALGISITFGDELLKAAVGRDNAEGGRDE